MFVFEYLTIFPVVSQLSGPQNLINNLGLSPAYYDFIRSRQLIDSKQPRDLSKVMSAAKEAPEINIERNEK